MLDFSLLILILTLTLFSLTLYKMAKYQKGRLGLDVSLSPELDTEVEEKIPLRYDEGYNAGGSYDPSGTPYDDSGYEGNEVYETVNRTYGVIDYQGLGHFPRKVYEGDSQNVFINLQPCFIKYAKPSKAVLIKKTKYGFSITVQVTEKQIIGKNFLEFELITAGFTVEGDKKQKQALSLDNLCYQWSCHFPYSGDQAFFIKVRVIDSQNKVFEIGKIELVTKVAKFDHMTQRQVWVLATASGVVSGIFALAEVLRRLGLW